jgi:hypothetical protein
MAETTIFSGTFFIILLFLLKESGIADQIIKVQIPEQVRKHKHLLTLSALQLFLPFLATRVLIGAYTAYSESISALQVHEGFALSQKTQSFWLSPIATTAIGIFIGNLLLNRIQEAKKEKRLVLRTVLHLEEIAKNFETIECIVCNSISTSNPPSLDPDAFRKPINESQSKRITDLCRMAQKEAKAISIYLSECIESEVASILRSELIGINIYEDIENVFSFFEIEKDQQPMNLNVAILIYIQLIFPLEIKIYGSFYAFKEYIPKRAWDALSTRIAGQFEAQGIGSRSFRIWRFVCHLPENYIPYIFSNPQSILEEYKTSKNKIISQFKTGK